MTTSFRLDHPRAPELVSLAKERDPESQERLSALLEELGLPADTFKAADAEGRLPAKDQVIVGDHVCEYEVTEHVIEIRRAIPAELAGKVVAHSERLGGWRSSTQINSDGESYQDASRTSMSQKFTEGAFCGLYPLLRDTLWECARFYRCWNPYVHLGSDGDWEILRYGEGDRFLPHADAISSPKRLRRQLTCLVYLNDGYEGGETKFHPPAPELAVKPEVGKVALFPPFYTHPHEGLPVTAGTKYVALGWFYP
jgi:hypothetical protein